MKSISVLALLFIVSTFSVFSQKSESVLFTVGDQAVMASEFQYIYEKNNKNDDNFYSEGSINEYLDLFIKFKLKVMEAKALGIDTTEAFKKEFNTYRSQLTKPYMTDEKTTEALIKEAYERMKYELRASHILILSKEDDDPAKIQEAEDKIKEIYKKAVKGEDFATLATQYSEDPSVKTNKGDLGYFSAFHLIYDFENVAYQTEVGKISKPFKTEFGFHILKITDKRPYQGQIKVAQIYLLVPPDADSTKETEIKQKAESIYEALEKGESFEKLVEMHSDDQRSKTNGGVMPEFTSFSYNIPNEFKEMAFSLKNDGDYSKPFKTRVGYHIIKRISLTGLKSFEENEKQIASQVKKDSRSRLTEANLIEKIKKENRFKLKTKSLQNFYTIADSSLLQGKWTIPNPENLNDKLFMIGKEVYTQLDFAKYINQKQRPNQFKHVPYAVDQYYKAFEKEMVLNYADRHLEENYPEFRNLVNEYKEGMMLFEITDEKVWTKAMNDTSGQKAYYDKNRSAYMWGKRADAEVLICKNQKVATDAKAMLDKGKKADEIAKTLNENDMLNISYTKGKYEETDNEDIQPYFGKEGAFIKKAEGEKDNWKVINIKKYLDPEVKKFEEIRGIVIADYQTYLENEWIKELKVKYPVEVYDDILKTIIHTK